MKKIFRFTLLLTFSLIATNQIWQNIYFQNIPLTIIKIAFVLSIFEIILKPIVKILLLPINILTLGTFRIIINTFGLYLVTFLFQDIQINNINYPPSIILGFQIPELQFNNFFAYLITSFTISFILYFFNLILHKKPKKS
ncbi:MAG: phage holin family protein [Candidatus Shapirobacteria bacterium]|nr:phage holin family protein [Candidatus Shapirobacteria bacterium]